MHHDELWQLFRQNGEPMIGASWESALGNPGADVDEIVGVAITFLYRRRENGGVEFLWQKRADDIDRYPGYYDLSAGGHINLGESAVEAAIREAREEIGARLDADDLMYGFMRPFNKNRFAWLYFVDYTDMSNEFHFDDNEVSEVKWVLYDEMRDFVHNYAKPPLAKDEMTFDFVDEWLKMHGII